MLGIALGCSKYTNGIIFCNPVLDSMSDVSTDFYWTRIDTLVKYLIASNMMGG